MLKRISKLFKKKPLGLEGAWDNSLLEEDYCIYLVRGSHGLYVNCLLGRMAQAHSCNKMRARSHNIPVQACFNIDEETHRIEQREW